VRDRHEAKESRGLGRAPLAARTVRKWDHHRLQLVARYLELADALELHGLAGEVLLRRHRVREHIQEEGPRARRVHPESHQVAHHRLGIKEGQGARNSMRFPTLNSQRLFTNNDINGRRPCAT
jgi:hypothetical protein